MLYYGANVLLLESLMRQAHADTAARCGYSDIETEDAAVRIRQDARDFLSSVQAAYIEIRDAAGAVMEVIARRRLAWPMVNETEPLPGEATCSRCEERKEAIQFYMVQRRGYAARLDSWCKSCRREYKNLRVGQLRTVGLKFCPTCQQMLAPSEFHADRSRYDGLCAHCHTCKAARSRKRRRL